MAIINFKNVTKIFRLGFTAKKVVAVKDLSFSIEKSTVTGFVGPNGAGKTTTIKLLLGLIRPTTGAITVNDRQSRDPSARRNVAFLPEQPLFYEHLTAYESLELAFKLQNIHTEPRNEIQRVLAEVELSDSSGKKVKNLSKGMQQRLSMAMALLGDPETYILDEPMSGLDPLGRRLFRTILKNLGERGKCVLFSTHALEDVSALCDKILVLSRGRLVYQGPVAALLTKGYEGAEIVVSGLPVAYAEQLRSQGYQITESNPESATIFIAAGKDPKACQKWLIDRGIFVDSLTPRNKSLESILYSPDSAGIGV